jgi:hypothetical protein
MTTPSAPASSSRVPLAKLPFVGLRRDGSLGYWVIPPIAEGQDQRLVGRTYAAWFLLYGEINGVRAAGELLDHIEREMPSHYPALDRAFLAEVSRPRALSA